MNDERDHFGTIREYLTHIGKVVGDKDFQSHLDKAGSMAALIGLGIRLYEDVKKVAQSKDEIAFNLLIKAAFECAEESISENISSRISIGDKSKDIRRELFNIFTAENGWDYYLPDHPVIKQFKSHFRRVLESEGHSNLVRDFILDFNKHLEDKIDSDQDLTEFKERIDDIERKSNLLNHLDYTGTLIYKVNEIDKTKCLADYYIENYAVKADIFDEWDKEDTDYLSDIDTENRNLHPASIIVMDSVKNSENPYTIVGAPFGIGKTSLSFHISSVYAQKYLDDPDRKDNYIPVFAPLKEGLDAINEKGQSLEDVLELIAPTTASGEARKKKIVVICDGLDEFGGGKNIYELKGRLDALRKQNKYPNITFVITTRLEANIPQELRTGLKTYIRLLPFSRSQVDDFFRKSKLPQYSFEHFKVFNVTEAYSGYGNVLADEIRKPLFCWMFASMVDSSPDIARVLEEKDANIDPPLRRALIYQQFIHSIIIGKHRESAKQYLEKYSQEKNLLRRIAALKQMYGKELLKESTVVAGLRDYYGLNYSKEDLRESKIITSYFYFKGTTTTDKTVGFIHKSFMEHLLAEYYIESITHGYEKSKYFLSIGIPSAETIQHLDGLLSLVNSTNKSFSKQIDTFVTSLQQTSQSDLNASIIENTKKLFQAGEIILQKGNTVQAGNEMWLVAKIPPDKYSNLWIHLWLSFYILNTLAPERSESDKDMLLSLILGTGSGTPYFLKRLVGVDLSEANLSRANLSRANLSRANLSRANLSRANLSTANLSRANLSRGNLSEASSEELISQGLISQELSSEELISQGLISPQQISQGLISPQLISTKLISEMLPSQKLISLELTSTKLTCTELISQGLIYQRLISQGLIS